ncbi:MAG: hypothetical protein IT463_09140 [Planctomycetes bacterium]|nr:hypothetical protein [Planctomycetota bacterium]
MDFLKKHGRFLAVLAVLSVLLYLASGEIGGASQRVDGARQKARALLSQNYKALFEDAGKYNGEPATTEARRVQDKTQSLAQVEKGRNLNMGFETSPAYTLAELGPDAKADDQLNFYNTRVLELKKHLSLQRYFGYTDDDNALGFPVAAKDATQVPGYLRRLDIVRAVSDSVARSGVQRLTALRFMQVNAELAARGVPAPAAEEAGTFFYGEGLEVDVRASEEALYNFLYDLQRPVKGELRNRYLAVEKFKFDKPDLLRPADNLITARITVVAYRVNDGAEYPKDANATSNQQQATTSKPRSFR